LKLATIRWMQTVSPRALLPSNAWLAGNKPFIYLTSAMLAAYNLLAQGDFQLRFPS